MNYLKILNLVQADLELTREDLNLNLTRIPAPGTCDQSRADYTNTIVAVVKITNRNCVRYLIIKSKMWQPENISSIEICDDNNPMNSLVKSHETFSNEVGYVRHIIDLICDNVL